MVDDVVFGCAMPEAEQGMNVARIASELAGIPHTAAAMTVNRFCSSGLQAIALADDAVRSGRAGVAVAGGTESMSLIPMGGHKVAPNPTLLETAELVARRYGLDRGAADAFALESHGKAVRAIDEGRFREETVPLTVTLPSEDGGEPRSITFDVDEGPRRDTDAAALARLRDRRQLLPDVGRRRRHGRDEPGACP
jgi:acetyl-CoA acyltransferase